MSFASGTLICVTIWLACLLLHVFLPGHVVKGYCVDEKTMRPLVYKLNGLSMLISSIGFFMLVPIEFKLMLYRQQKDVSLAACLLGCLISWCFYQVSQARQGKIYERCPTIDHINGVFLPKALSSSAHKSSSAKDFFLGHIFNPRFRLFHVTVDIKMFLYAVGAIQLQLNNLSFLYHHFDTNHSTVSVAYQTYFWLFAWFISEYMFFERPHLYTYDIFAEKIGFKLVWGCLFFYPFFYPLNGYLLSDIDIRGGTGEDISWHTAYMIGALFFVGWIFTRGANMQKYFYKRFPNDRYIFGGVIEQVNIPKSRILVSGFWGLSRHVNYMGEVIQAIAISLPLTLVSIQDRNNTCNCTTMCVALTYPLYYICLFISRQIDDDALCQKKYGEAWTKYTEKVKYKIIPGIY